MMKRTYRSLSGWIALTGILLPGITLTGCSKEETTDTPPPAAAPATPATGGQTNSSMGATAQPGAPVPPPGPVRSMEEQHRDKAGTL